MVQKRWLRLMVVWLVPVSVLMAAAVGAGADEAAKHFTFTVPLQFHKLDAGIKKVKVSCKIYKEANLESIMGGRDVQVDVPASPDGEFVKDAVISFDEYGGKNPADAKFYQCQFYVTDEVTGWRNPGEAPYPAKAGAPLKDHTPPFVPFPAPGAPAQ